MHQRDVTENLRKDAVDYCIVPHDDPMCVHTAESEKGAHIYSLRRLVATNAEHYAYGEHGRLWKRHTMTISVIRRC